MKIVNSIKNIDRLYKYHERKKRDSKAANLKAGFMLALAICAIVVLAIFTTASFSKAVANEELYSSDKVAVNAIATISDKVIVNTNENRNASFDNIDGETSIKQLTNIEYCSQKVNFVPAFSNDNKSYLKDNNVEFYTDSSGQFVDNDIHDLIYSENGCTMNELYPKLLKDPGASSKECKTLYAKADAGVTFYGVLDETWNNVFTEPSSTPGIATDYNTLSYFYKFLDDKKGIGTVYFGSKNSHIPQSEGNWDCVNSCYNPTLNGVDYSKYKKNTEDTSTFYWAYGGHNGGVLSRRSNFPWSSFAYNDYDAYYWDALYSAYWWNYHCDLYSDVVVSLAF